jgi:hypothetical protein
VPCPITSSPKLALVIGLRSSFSNELTNSGPVHTLREELTPEMVAAQQKEYQTEDQARKASRTGEHGMHFPRRVSRAASQSTSTM